MPYKCAAYFVDACVQENTKVITHCICFHIFMLMYASSAESFFSVVAGGGRCGSIEFCRRQRQMRSCFGIGGAMKYKDGIRSCWVVSFLTMSIRITSCQPKDLADHLLECVRSNDDKSVDTLKVAW